LRTLWFQGAQIQTPSLHFDVIQLHKKHLEGFPLLLLS